MLNLARYLTIGQLAGMIIAMIGLIADAKMPRDPAKPDRAVSAIFRARGHQRRCLAVHGVPAPYVGPRVNKLAC